jgi:hypothetical protein
MKFFCSVNFIHGSPRNRKEKLEAPSEGIKYNVECAKYSNTIVMHIYCLTASKKQRIAKV